MIMRAWFGRGMTAGLLLGLMACSGAAAPAGGTTSTVEPLLSPPTQLPVPTSTARPATAQSPAAAPEATDPADDAITLRVWIPEPLMPVANERAAALLEEQIDGFLRANLDLDVELRRKAASETGGQEAGTIMATLRSAAAVAPGALPDLTLLRRADFVAAGQSGLLQAIDAALFGEISADLHPATSALGRGGEDIFGLPYMIDVKHLAYQEDAALPAQWQFEDILTTPFPFAFPAGRANVLSDLLYAQYVSAGEDVLVDSALTVDAEALRTVFRFYERALADGVITADVLQYNTPADYRALLESGALNAGLVTSTLYMDLVAADVPLGYAPLPTASGTPVTVVDGWIWVIITTDTDRQAAAERLLQWLFDVERQSLYADAVGMLPSQRAALRMLEDDAYSAFIDGLLANALLPPESGVGTVARAIQTAFVALLSGQRSALDAARDVIAQTGG